MSSLDKELREHFIYGNYKADTGELFYIGIGKRRNGSLNSEIYARAYQCSNKARNYLWLRCYNKHGRTVKILYDNLTEKECKNKEIELISKYGRLINGSGNLCNISGGGEGRFMDNSNNKMIYVYNLQGSLINTFESCNAAADYYGLDRRNVGLAANMKRITCGNLQFRYNYNKDINIKNLDKPTRKFSKSIICINQNTGETLKFNSVYKFTIFLGIKSNSHILEVLKEKRNNVKGWKVYYDL